MNIITKKQWIRTAWGIWNSFFQSTDKVETKVILNLKYPPPNLF